jgi:TonB-linked SusC/RagA family outer membrane protein
MRKKMSIFSKMTAAVLLCLPLSIFTQSLPVSGTVTDISNGKPLEGVDIQVKDTDNKVVTDEDGNYDIFVKRNFFTPSPPPVLVFSHKDYEKVEIEVVDDQMLNVSLKSRSESGQVKVFCTGTAQDINCTSLPFSGQLLDDPLLINQVPAVNVSSSLQGKVAGLSTFQPGYQPGQDAYLQFRAANTLSNGQHPLILVDGIYLSNISLADINTDDIERIEILSGAASSAAYGSQGGNGVIQIFTRTGNEVGIGKTQVRYRGEFGFSEALNTYALSEFTNRNVLDPTGAQPILGDVTADGIQDTPLPNLRNYQNDVLFQNGSYNSQYLSIAGKTSTTRFMASAQYLKDQGIIQAMDGFTRYSVRANLDHQAGKRLHLSFRSAYTNQQQDALPQMATGPANYLTNALFLTPIFNLNVPNEEDGSTYDWDIDNTGGNITNPEYLKKHIDQQSSRNRLLGSFSAELKATDWLSFDYTATLDYYNQQYRYFIEKGYLSTAIPGGFSNFTTAGYIRSDGGAYQQNTSLRNFLTSTTGFKIQRSWLGFSTNLRGGVMYENNTYQFNGAAGEDLAVEGIRSLDNPRQNLRISSEEQQIIGYNAFLIADADYKDKYIFSGAYRMEQSSLFGGDTNWPGFYRASAAYRISEDLSLKFFQDLKIHAGIGTAGIRPAFNQRFETYALINGTLEKQTLGNDALLPIRSTELEVGLTTTFLNAFSLQANYVKVTNEDQIIYVPLSGGAGFAGQWRNAGTLEANVYEGIFNIDVAKLLKMNTKSFRWDITATGQKIDQSITALNVPAYSTGPGIENSAVFRMEEGGSPGAIYGEVFATTVEELTTQNDINITEYTLNDLGYIVRVDELGTPDERPVKLLDENGNPVLQAIGNTTPDFRMGFSNRFAFKGLQLYALVDWKIGGDIYNLSKQQLYGHERHADLSKHETSASFFSEGLHNEGVANMHFVEDGSFVMLREAALSYTFDKMQLSFLGGAVESVKLALIGRNLFTATDYSGIHPDISSATPGENVLTSRLNGGLGSNVYAPAGDPALFAIDGFGYPARRTFSFSLEATF